MEDKTKSIPNMGYKKRGLFKLNATVPQGKLELHIYHARISHIFEVHHSG